MAAWADGLNYFLAEHPGVAPKVIHHFEPWMALSFTEGSIGGDIESVDLAKLREFYPVGPPLQEAHTANSFECGHESGPGRLQWFCHRAQPQRIGPRPAVDQSAYLVLLPLRTADGQRARIERLRRRHLGPVLRLPGIQLAQRLDAHLIRRRCHR